MRAIDSKALHGVPRGCVGFWAAWAPQRPTSPPPDVSRSAAFPCTHKRYHWLLEIEGQLDPSSSLRSRSVVARDRGGRTGAKTTRRTIHVASAGNTVVALQLTPGVFGAGTARGRGEQVPETRGPNPGQRRNRWRNALLVHPLHIDPPTTSPHTLAFESQRLAHTPASLTAHSNNSHAEDRTSGEEGGPLLRMLDAHRGDQEGQVRHGGGWAARTMMLTPWMRNSFGMRDDARGLATNSFGPTGDDSCGPQCRVAGRPFEDDDGGHNMKPSREVAHLMWSPMSGD